MYATDLIYNSIRASVDNVVSIDGICAVCGKRITEGISIKKVVSGTFTDWNILANITSDYVCCACTWCIKEPRMRRSQWIATKDELKFFKRDDIGIYLFSPPETPFVFFITATYKKHGSFRARVNGSRDLFYIQFEDRQVLFSPNRYKELWAVMNRMYRTFNKTSEIGRGDYIQKRVFEYGIDKWRNDEEMLKQYRGTQVFELLLYALNKQEEDKKKK